MRSIQSLIRYFLYAEMLLLGVFYVGSPHGVQSITRLVHEHQAVEKQVMNLKGDIAGLEIEIVQWESEPFYKEKIAREQLQMVHKHEVIYYYAAE